MKWYLWGAVVLLYSLFGSACSTERRYDLSAYGLSPVENVDNAPAMARALEQIREKCEENQTIVVTPCLRAAMSFIPIARRSVSISSRIMIK